MNEGRIAAGVQPTPAAPPAVPPSRRPAVSWNVWIDEAGRSGAWNMATDQDLLLAAQRGESFLRLYRWTPGCLSFGRNEPALARYDRDRISQRGLDTVRRPTGGRAVWHDAEVTYAIAAPTETFGSLTDSYRAIHQILARALASLGIDAAIAPRPLSGHAALGSGSCFASPAGGEVIVGGRKLIGSAQIREGNGFLQHGSILLEDGQDIVSEVTRGARLPVQATSISATLKRPVGFSEVCSAIVAEPSAPWNGGAVRSDLVPGTAQLAQFADPTWTWRR